MSKIFQQLLAISLLIFFVLSLYYSNQMRGFSSSMTNKVPYDAHYAVVLVGTEKGFFKEIQKGIEALRSTMNIAVEYYIMDSTDEAQAKIRMLMLSGIDGLITQGINEDSFAQTLDQVVEEKIPLVLVNTDLITVKRDAFVGTNPFEMGVKGASLWAYNEIPLGQIIYLTQSVSSGSEDNVSKLQLMGFRDGLESKGIQQVVIDESSKSEILSAEERLSDLFLNEGEPIGSVVCTTLNDTLGVAQAVVDLNRVGTVKIVGTGLNSQLVDYIKKGVIVGTLFQNPKKMGNKALGLLNSIALKGNDGKVDGIEHIEIPLEIITKENLSEFLIDIDGDL